MAGKRRKKIQQRDITGLKFFDKLAPLLARLHDDGCARDRAGNRELHYDQYCMLILLYLFNPTLVSLRAVQQASELPNVQRKLGCSRAALGSLSEATTVFDPERLKAIIAELGTELQPVGRDPRLRDVPGALTAVDGTLLAALPKLMLASCLKRATGSGLVKWRLHTHFEVDRHVPLRIDVTPNGGGAHDERSVLERTIESDRTYVMDRGYAKFALFNKIVAAGSSYVCRVRDNSSYEVLESRELTQADRALNVLSDQLVQIGKQGKEYARPDHPIRLLEIRTTPHSSRGQVQGRFDRAGHRWHSADRHQPARRAGRSHRPDLHPSLDHRNLLSLFQARARLPSPAQPQPAGHRDPSLHGNHWLHADQPVDGPQTDAANV